MKKSYLKVAIGILFLANITTFAFAATKTNVIRPSAPVVSPGLKPIVADYRNGNYIQSMIKLEELLEKEPENTYANYYMALTYTRLGKKEEAEKYYNKVITLNSNMSLRYYSQKALACLNNPEDRQCSDISSTNRLVTKKSTNESSDEKNAQEDEMTKFIKSGKKIHPAAADAITRERMERKLQADEYLRQHQENSPETEKQSLIAPTNEEVMAAIETLTKAGLNPYDSNSIATYDLAFKTNSSNDLLNNDFNLYSTLFNSNNKSMQMMLLNQLTQSQNIANYGI